MTETLHCTCDGSGRNAPCEIHSGNGPQLLERGRHAITGMPDGSWVITRAGPICESCQECGCGEQQEPIHVPAMVVSLITMDPEKRAKLTPAAMMARLLGRGRLRGMGQDGTDLE